MSIDLSEIRYCFIDFDDTLCVRTKRREDDDEYFNSTIRHDWTFYKRSERVVGKGMKKFVKECSKLGIKLFILTHDELSLKQYMCMGWANYIFGEGVFADTIVVSDPSKKVEFLKRISSANKMPRNQILIVDDFGKTLNDCDEACFETASPQEVAVLFG